MIPHSEWKWYGYAGHLVVGSRCAFHLSTRIGGYLVSTVGHYLPKHKDDPEPIGAGSYSMFETFVFRCGGDDVNGDPIILNLTPVDSTRYATSKEAEDWHYVFCDRYARKDLR